MNRKWIIKRLKNTRFKEPVLIEGLPGMGNVAKITIDFIIESLKAEKIYEISSYGFPNIVLVDEKGIADLPKVEVYHKRIKGKDFFLVSGDVQPVDEENSYEFCDKLLDIFQEFNGREVVTLGGIGLEEPPKSPRVYCSGTTKKIIDNYKIDGVKSAEGVVGPIIGVSGLLLGLAKARGLSGAILLVETLGAPTYLGIREARELVKVLNKKFKLGLDIDDLNREVKIIEKEIGEKLNKFMVKEERKLKTRKEYTNYIG